MIKIMSRRATDELRFGYESMDVALSGWGWVTPGVGRKQFFAGSASK
jgi:hypothetical protein